MPLEHITGNIYNLPEGNKIVDSNGRVAYGPAMIRVLDYDDNFHSLQIDSPNGEFHLEIQGDLNSFVQKNCPQKDSPSPDATLK